MKGWPIIILIAFNLTFFFPANNGHNYGYTSAVVFVYSNEMKLNIGDDISQKTIQIFKNADSNGDGKISVWELQTFQNWLKTNFKYKHNNTALHPDDFIDQGGGDCEDFAIMTTCMLNYHGVVAFVAHFGRVTVNKHSLTIVQVKNNRTPGYLYYNLNNWRIPSGYYIPIDYTKIGGLSAIDKRWKIAAITNPKEIYGRYI